MAYWKNLAVAEVRPLSNGYVTHRERGVIPGCTTAVDVFIERTPEMVASYNMASAARYCHDLNTMKFQDFINKPLEKALPFFRNN